MWRVYRMDQRQVRELEIYAKLEPIGWDVTVSRPPENVDETDASPGDEAALAVKLDTFFGH